jgi:hypothetical protein
MIEPADARQVNAGSRAERIKRVSSKRKAAESAEESAETSMNLAIQDEAHPPLAVKPWILRENPLRAQRLGVSLF